MILGNGRNKTLMFDDHCALKKFLLRDSGVAIAVLATINLATKKRLRMETFRWDLMID